MTKRNPLHRNITASSSSARLAWLLKRRRVVKVLDRLGIIPRIDKEQGQITVTLDVQEPVLTDQQRRIHKLLECGPLLQTAQDIARGLGQDPANLRVLGQIGKDCVALDCHSRQVPRLDGVHKMRVYSYWAVGGSLKGLRARYQALRRRTGGNRRTQAKKVPTAL